MGQCCNSQGPFRFKSLVVAVYPSSHEYNVLLKEHKKHGGAGLAPYEQYMGTLNADALGKLISYVVTNPQRIPRVCRKLQKLIVADFARNKKNKVFIGLQILKELLQESCQCAMNAKKSSSSGSGGSSGSSSAALGASDVLDYYAGFVLFIVGWVLQRATMLSATFNCPNVSPPSIPQASSGEQGRGSRSNTYLLGPYNGSRPATEKSVTDSDAPRQGGQDEFTSLADIDTNYDDFMESCYLEEYDNDSDEDDDPGLIPGGHDVAIADDVGAMTTLEYYLAAVDLLTTFTYFLSGSLAQKTSNDTYSSKSAASYSVITSSQRRLLEALPSQIWPFVSAMLTLGLPKGNSRNSQGKRGPPGKSYDTAADTQSYVSDVMALHARYAATVVFNNILACIFYSSNGHGIGPFTARALLARLSRQTLPLLDTHPSGLVVSVPRDYFAFGARGKDDQMVRAFSEGQELIGALDCISCCCRSEGDTSGAADRRALFLQRLLSYHWLIGIQNNKKVRLALGLKDSQNAGFGEVAQGASASNGSIDALLPSVVMGVVLALQNHYRFRSINKASSGHRANRRDAVRPSPKMAGRGNKAHSPSVIQLPEAEPSSAYNDIGSFSGVGGTPYEGSKMGEAPSSTAPASPMSTTSGTLTSAGVCDFTMLFDIGGLAPTSFRQEELALISSLAALIPTLAAPHAYAVGTAVHELTLALGPKSGSAHVRQSMPLALLNLFGISPSHEDWISTPVKGPAGGSVPPYMALCGLISDHNGNSPVVMRCDTGSSCSISLPSGNPAGGGQKVAYLRDDTLLLMCVRCLFYIAQSGCYSGTLLPRQQSNNIAFRAAMADDGELSRFFSNDDAGSIYSVAAPNPHATGKYMVDRQSTIRSFFGRSRSFQLLDFCTALASYCEQQQLWTLPGKLHLYFCGGGAPPGGDASEQAKGGTSSPGVNSLDNLIIKQFLKIIWNFEHNSYYGADKAGDINDSFFFFLRESQLCIDYSNNNTNNNNTLYHFNNNISNPVSGQANDSTNLNYMLHLSKQFFMTNRLTRTTCTTLCVSPLTCYNSLFLYGHQTPGSPSGHIRNKNNNNATSVAQLLFQVSTAALESRPERAGMLLLQQLVRYAHMRMGKIDALIERWTAVTVRLLQKIHALHQASGPAGACGTENTVATVDDPWLLLSMVSTAARRLGLSLSTLIDTVFVIVRYSIAVVYQHAMLVGLLEALTSSLRLVPILTRQAIAPFLSLLLSLLNWPYSYSISQIFIPARPSANPVNLVAFTRALYKLCIRFIYQNNWDKEGATIDQGSANGQDSKETENLRQKITFLLSAETLFAMKMRRPAPGDRNDLNGDELLADLADEDSDRDEVVPFSRQADSEVPGAGPTGAGRRLALLFDTITQLAQVMIERVVAGGARPGTLGYRLSYSIPRPGLTPPCQDGLDNQTDSWQTTAYRDKKQQTEDYPLDLDRVSAGMVEINTTCFHATGTTGSTNLCTADAAETAQRAAPGETFFPLLISDTSYSILVSFCNKLLENLQSVYQQFCALGSPAAHVEARGAAVGDRNNSITSLQGGAGLTPRANKLTPNGISPFMLDSSIEHAPGISASPSNSLPLAKPSNSISISPCRGYGTPGANTSLTHCHNTSAASDVNSRFAWRLLCGNLEIIKLLASFIRHHNAKQAHQAAHERMEENGTRCCPKAFPFAGQDPALGSRRPACRSTRSVDEAIPLLPLLLDIIASVPGHSGPSITGPNQPAVAPSYLYYYNHYHRNKFLKFAIISWERERNRLAKLKLRASKSPSPPGEDSDSDIEDCLYNNVDDATQGFQGGSRKLPGLYKAIRRGRANGKTSIRERRPDESWAEATSDLEDDSDEERKAPHGTTSSPLLIREAVRSGAMACLQHYFLLLPHEYHFYRTSCVRRARWQQMQGGSPEEHHQQGPEPARTEASAGHKLPYASKDLASALATAPTLLTPYLAHPELKLILSFVYQMLAPPPPLPPTPPIALIRDLLQLSRGPEAAVIGASPLPSAAPAPCSISPAEGETAEVNKTDDATLHYDQVLSAASCLHRYYSEYYTSCSFGGSGATSHGHGTNVLSPSNSTFYFPYHTSQSLLGVNNFLMTLALLLGEGGCLTLLLPLLLKIQQEIVLSEQTQASCLSEVEEMVLREVRRVKGIPIDSDSPLVFASASSASTALTTPLHSCLHQVLTAAINNIGIVLSFYKSHRTSAIYATPDGFKGEGARDDSTAAAGADNGASLACYLINAFSISNPVAQLVNGLFSVSDRANPRADQYHPLILSQYCKDIYHRRYFGLAPTVAEDHNRATSAGTGKEEVCRANAALPASQFPPYYSPSIRPPLLLLLELLLSKRGSYTNQVRSYLLELLPQSVVDKYIGSSKGESVEASDDAEARLEPRAKQLLFRIKKLLTLPQYTIAGAMSFSSPSVATTAGKGSSGPTKGRKKQESRTSIGNGEYDYCFSDALPPLLPALVLRGGLYNSSNSERRARFMEHRRSSKRKRAPAAGLADTTADLKGAASSPQMKADSGIGDITLLLDDNHVNDSMLLWMPPTPGRLVALWACLYNYYMCALEPGARDTPEAKTLLFADDDNAQVIRVGSGAADDSASGAEAKSLQLLFCSSYYRTLTGLPYDLCPKNKDRRDTANASVPPKRGHVLPLSLSPSVVPRVSVLLKARTILHLLGFNLNDMIVVTGALLDLVCSNGGVPDQSALRSLASKFAVIFNQRNYSASCDGKPGSQIDAMNNEHFALISALNDVDTSDSDRTDDTIQLSTAVAAPPPPRRSFHPTTTSSSLKGNPANVPSTAFPSYYACILADPHYLFLAILISQLSRPVALTPLLRGSFADGALYNSSCHRSDYNCLSARALREMACRGATTGIFADEAPAPEIEADATAADGGGLLTTLKRGLSMRTGRSTSKGDEKPASAPDAAAPTASQAPHSVMPPSLHDGSVRDLSVRLAGMHRLPLGAGLLLPVLRAGALLSRHRPKLQGPGDENNESFDHKASGSASMASDAPGEAELLLSLLMDDAFYNDLLDGNDLPGTSGSNVHAEEATPSKEICNPYKPSYYYPHYYHNAYHFHIVMDSFHLFIDELVSVATGSYFAPFASTGGSVSAKSHLVTLRQHYFYQAWLNLQDTAKMRLVPYYLLLPVIEIGGFEPNVAAGSASGLTGPANRLERFILDKIRASVTTGSEGPVHRRVGSNDQDTDRESSTRHPQTLFKGGKASKIKNEGHSVASEDSEYNHIYSYYTSFDSDILLHFILTASSGAGSGNNNNSSALLYPPHPFFNDLIQKIIVAESSNNDEKGALETQDNARSLANTGSFSTVDFDSTENNQMISASSESSISSNSSVSRSSGDESESYGPNGNEGPGAGSNDSRRASILRHASHVMERRAGAGASNNHAVTTVARWKRRPQCTGGSRSDLPRMCYAIATDLLMLSGELDSSFLVTMAASTPADLGYNLVRLANSYRHRPDHGDVMNISVPSLLYYNYNKTPLSVLLALQDQEENRQRVLESIEAWKQQANKPRTDAGSAGTAGLGDIATSAQTAQIREQITSLRAASAHLTRVIHTLAVSSGPFHVASYRGVSLISSTVSLEQQVVYFMPPITAVPLTFYENYRRQQSGNAVDEGTLVTHPGLLPPLVPTASCGSIAYIYGPGNAPSEATERPPAGEARETRAQFNRLPPSALVAPATTRAFTLYPHIIATRVVSYYTGIAPPTVNNLRNSRTGHIHMSARGSGARQACLRQCRLFPLHYDAVFVGMPESPVLFSRCYNSIGFRDALPPQLFEKAMIDLSAKVPSGPAPDRESAVGIPSVVPSTCVTAEDSERSEEKELLKAAAAAFSPPACLLPPTCPTLMDRTPRDDEAMRRAGHFYYNLGTATGPKADPNGLPSAQQGGKNKLPSNTIFTCRSLHSISQWRAQSLEAALGDRAAAPSDIPAITRGRGGGGGRAGRWRARGGRDALFNDDAFYFDDPPSGRYEADYRDHLWGRFSNTLAGTKSKAMTELAHAMLPANVNPNNTINIYLKRAAGIFEQ